MYVLFAIILMIYFLTVKSILMNNYKFVDKFTNMNINKTSFYYYDAIEIRDEKKLIYIDHNTRYIFYICNMNGNNYNFDFNNIPRIIFHDGEESKKLFETVCMLMNEKLYTELVKKVVFTQIPIQDAIKRKVSMYLTVTTKPIHEYNFNHGIYNYNKLDIRMLLEKIPYAYMMPVVTKNSDDIRHKFIMFDECLYTLSSHMSIYKNCKKTDNTIKNLYNMYGFKIHELTQDEYNECDSLKILEKEKINKESFTPGSRMQYTATMKVPGKVTQLNKYGYIQFTATSSIQDTLKLKINPGDVIILSNNNKIENNKYYYLNDTTLSTAFIINDGGVIKGNTILYSSKDMNYMMRNDYVYFEVYKKLCTINKLLLVNNGINIECSIIEPFEQYNHECVSNLNIKFEDQCKSDYTLDGKKKNKKDIWDKRCESHTECPFFDLDNYNGLCENGYCQMPLGVELKGYTQFETNSLNNECPIKRGDKCVFKNDTLFNRHLDLENRQLSYQSIDHGHFLKNSFQSFPQPVQDSLESSD